MGRRVTREPERAEGNPKALDTTED